MRTGWGNPKYSKKTCPSANQSTASPSWTDLELNPGCCGENPPTNCLSYSIAYNIATYWRQCACCYWNTTDITKCSKQHILTLTQISAVPVNSPITAFKNELYYVRCLWWHQVVLQRHSVTVMQCNQSSHLYHMTIAEQTKHIFVFAVSQRRW
jgi:hypothetical protein